MAKTDHKLNCVVCGGGVVQRPGPGRLRKICIKCATEPTKTENGDGCTWCGKIGTFRKNKVSKNFCSRACRKREYYFRKNGHGVFRPSQCIVCRKPIDQSGRTPKKYCGSDCGKIHRGEWGPAKFVAVVFKDCKHCGKSFTSKPRDGQTSCSKACALAFRIRHPPRPCLVCGAVFKPKMSRGALPVACGHRCGAILAVRSKGHVLREHKPIVVRTWFAHCELCSILFRAPTEGSRYCSLDCRKTGTKANIIAGFGRRPCGQCGAEMDLSQIGKKIKFCSEACKKQHASNTMRVRKASKASKDKRAARRKTPKGRAEKRNSKHVRRVRLLGQTVGKVSILQVFARDGWKCIICGIDTPQILRGTRLHNAPELDHIIPISRGGGHTMANVRCACRSCNGLKSTMLDGELDAMLAA